MYGYYMFMPLWISIISTLICMIDLITLVLLLYKKGILGLQTYRTNYNKLSDQNLEAIVIFDYQDHNISPCFHNQTLGH